MKYIIIQGFVQLTLYNVQHGGMNDCSNKCVQKEFSILIQFAESSTNIILSLSFILYNIHTLYPAFMKSYPYSYHKLSNSL